MGLTEEPFGHRGHPTSPEKSLAEATAKRLEACIERLESSAFGRDEAIGFIAGVAYECARERGETWTSSSGPRRSVTNVLDGRGSKFWAIVAMNQAVNEIEKLSQ